MRESEGPRLSDEFLNAFVDNQIDADEKSRAYPLISGDENLNRQVCEIRKISDLVRLAYDALPPPKKATVRPGRRHLDRLKFLIAPMVLTVGIALGWSLRTLWSPEPLPLLAPIAVAHANHGVLATRGRLGGSGAEGRQTTAAAGIITKVLFHLDNGDRAHMRQVLEEAQHLLARYRADHRRAEVEILADGPGLTLLRRHLSPFVVRIAMLQKQYPNLVFAACQDTINRLERRKGIDPRLVPQAIIVPSAIAEIVRLQHHGWTYVRV